MKVIKIFVAVIVVVFSIFILNSMVFFTTRGYCNVYTGTRKTFVEFPFGIKTPTRVKPSIFENRLTAIPGVSINEKWISYNGTGNSIFCMSISWGHGNPGAVYDVNTDEFATWLSSKNNDDVLKLYEVFKTEDQILIKKVMKNIYEEIFKD